MLPSVTFAYVDEFCGKRISKKRAGNSLWPSSTVRAWTAVAEYGSVDCFFLLRVVSKLLLPSAGTLSQQLPRCWELSQLRSSSLRRVYDDYYFLDVSCNGLWRGFSVSDVINFRLGQVITPRWFLGVGAAGFV